MISTSDDVTSTIANICICLVIYSSCLAIFRIYFSSLSHIPGPKIPIATWWYECFFDVWKRGVYYKEVKDFHERYGPIVRINPHEVHIDDPGYFDELNNNNGKWEKYEPYMAQFNSPGAVISTAQYDLHRMRRKPENNFFSKRNIVALEPLIYEHVERLCKRMEEFKENKSPLTVNRAMQCFTGDVVSEYVFGESWHLLDTADFAPWMLSANKKIGEYSHALKQWPWLIHILNALPLPWIASVAPDVAKILKYQELALESVIRIRNENSGNEKPGSTIVRSLLDSNLPVAEKSTFRLTKESFTLIAAGGDTTGSAVAMILYHLISNPTKLARIRTDLGPLFSDPLRKPTWTQLEDVPYMMGIVKEGLRMNMGVTSRVPRCAPDRDTQYKGIVIPRGTPVSMSIPDIHDNPDIFPEPKTFKPERWLSDDGKQSSNKLDRWLCAFSKGNRQCLGMNLAYAEIYLCIATLVMRFDFELFETTRDDVDWQHDFTVPQPKLTSKFIRVIVG